MSAGFTTSITIKELINKRKMKKRGKKKKKKKKRTKR